ncbi:ATP-binding cassette domain-containing protein [Alkalibacter saccharofermentans]|uniref:Tungstate transport system ATP-binding protein n=1 Tax=Alkalibacter saccharofermentans DSM 14828 TaxID=1120975 RepID=A0A1M4TNE0_9FIRM|nr:ABC transporter ATP-binding protein [Alkalibacter saccharofermentans]SHE46012.1 tungstate transport system ATP-binding protein [Alkalibacter saccharofermentans DSM 14828]
MRVEIKKAKKICDNKIILDVEDVCLETGKIYALLGPNGAGKTTLLRAISGVDKGCVREVSFEASDPWSSRSIGYMPQSAYLFDTTVEKNVFLGFADKSYSKQKMEKLAFDALEKVGMDKFAKSKARSLSGGESQRVALARMLVMKKDLILLDEPTSATDVVGAELIESYLMDLNKSYGMTFVFSTHNPSQASRIAHEVIFMNNGRICEKGDAREVLDNPGEAETEKFLKNWRLK